MKTFNHFTLLLLCALLSIAATFAQTSNPISQDVTIIIQQEQVRFTSQKAVQMMQLQIFNQAGEKVYDSSPMTVAEITWPLQNVNGEALKSGLYAYTLSLQESGAADVRVRRGHFIVDRVLDRDTKTDKLWVTSQNESSIGTELTVARSEGSTVAGTSSERTTTTPRDTTQREAASRGETPSTTKTAKATAEAASGTVGQIAKFITGTDLGNSLMTEKNGSIGIGTANPEGLFHVHGTSGGISTGITTSGAGAGFFFRNRETATAGDYWAWYSQGNIARFWRQGVGDLLAIKTDGSVGIGMAPSGYKLDVNGQLRTVRGNSNDLVVETTAGTNAWAKMWMITPSQKWNIGTAHNYKGNQYYLHDATFDQVRMTVQPNGGAIAFPLGDVGIGTTTPQAKLHVLSSTQNTATIYGESTSSGGVGVYARNLSGGRALYAEGDTGQSRDKGGLVKAMIFVNQDGTIARCFNGITGATTGNCGIDVTRQYDGVYLVDFHSQVNDRFFSLTAQGSYGTTYNESIKTGANFYFAARGITSNTQVVIKTFITDAEYTAAASFMLIVY